MKIKRSPEDFRVEEVMGGETARLVSDRPGAFLLLRATKRGLGTGEMIERLSLELGIPRRSIGFGGLKDKHALTTQYVSVPAGLARPLAGEPLPLPGVRGVEIACVGWLPRPFESSDVAGNRFDLVLRGLTRRESAVLDDRRRFLSVAGSRGRTLRLVNYYGGQRFGSGAREGNFAARLLMAGAFEEALRLLIAAPSRKDARARKDVRSRIAEAWGRWGDLARTLPPCPERAAVRALARGEDVRRAIAALPSLDRQMAIEAFQSRLWNGIARKLIRELAPASIAEARGLSGPLLFPEAAGVPETIIPLVIPLLSPATRLEEPWRRAAEETLADEGIDLADLAVPGMRSLRFGEVPRRLFVEAERCAFGPAEPDETEAGRGRFKRRARFFLPRGAYATVLLAALGAGDQNILT